MDGTVSDHDAGAVVLLDETAYLFATDLTPRPIILVPIGSGRLVCGLTDCVYDPLVHVYPSGLGVHVTGKSVFT